MVEEGDTYYGWTGINRTFMELKQKQMVLVLRYQKVLIEPLWN